MENFTPEPHPTKDIQDILGQRRETLARVRADLRTVSKLQEDFAAGKISPRGSGAPARLSLKEIPANEVRLISLGESKITLLFNDNQTAVFTYDSPDALDREFKAWSELAAAADMERLNSGRTDI